ncbi:hypothetical protein POVCU2_0013140 [Plasmodium ovale curtisi]|uniref:PIR Superfamily Protein n=1 Tax=Plasmodium ovale curtisi TaxID=864141 RepID=A0A1A8VT31_PLAOA|nr:hypothetical protein POVCU2_0013140 [Plasmodium ovale curtisi]
MQSNVGKSNLPSIERYKILEENIQYSTIDKNIDMGNKTDIPDFDDDDMIQNRINNFITMFLKPYECDESLRYSNEEGESAMNNNKSLYDLCGDIFYIE